MKKINKILLVTVVLLLGVILVGCSGGNDLVGRWYDGVNRQTYEFFSDGTGRVTPPPHWSPWDFTWEVRRGVLTTEDSDGRNWQERTIEISGDRTILRMYDIEDGRLIREFRLAN